MESVMARRLLLLVLVAFAAANDAVNVQLISSFITEPLVCVLAAPLCVLGAWVTMPCRLLRVSRPLQLLWPFFEVLIYNVLHLCF